MPTGYYLSLFRRGVFLLGSPQDTYSPLSSCLAVEERGKEGGIWGGFTPHVHRLSVQFESLKDLNGERASQMLSPKDSLATPPPLTLTAAAGMQLLSVFDSVSGRDAHLAFCSSEAVAAMIALGLGGVWEG